MFLSKDEKEVICQALQSYAATCNDTLNNSLSEKLQPTIQLDLSKEITIALNLLDLIKKSKKVELSADILKLNKNPMLPDPFDNMYNADT